MTEGQEILIRPAAVITACVDPVDGDEEVANQALNIARYIINKVMELDGNVLTEIDRLRNALEAMGCENEQTCGGSGGYCSVCLALETELK